MKHPVFAAVKAIILNQDGEFLIVRQEMPDGSFIWDLPGGKMEYGESPIEALEREVYEETRISLDGGAPRGMFSFRHPTHPFQVAVTVFLCESFSGNPDISRNPAQENISDFRWVTKDAFLSHDIPTGGRDIKKCVKDILS